MLIDDLKQKFPDMPELRVREVKVDKAAKKVYCAVSYPNSTDLPSALQAEIKKSVIAAIPKGYRHDVRLVNDKFNEKSFAAVLLDLIKKKYPLYANIKSDRLNIKLEGRDIKAEFLVSKSVKQSMLVTPFLQELDNFFLNYTCYRVQFFVTEDVNATVQSVDLKEQEKLVQLAINRELIKPQRHFLVDDVTRYMGKIIATNPMYISDIRKPMPICVVCGRISNKELRDTKIKDDTSSERKENKYLKLLKFDLTDDSGATLPCLMFVRLKIDDMFVLRQEKSDKTESELQTICEKNRLSNDNKLKKLLFLGDGLEVLVRGKLVYSQFSERLELQLYDVCKCRILPIEQQPKFRLKAPDLYLLVKPTTLAEYRQMTLITQEEKPSLLSGKDVVALVANTTGMSIVKDRIISLCAIRIVDGHVKEQFATLIAPEMPVLDSLLKECDITSKQLSVSPTLTEVIPDLFKFLGDSMLIGESLPQILDMFNYFGAPLGYEFTNKTKTAYQMLSDLFDRSIYENKPNCSQIADVVKALKINCKTGQNSVEKATALALCLTNLAQNVR